MTILKDLANSELSEPLHIKPAGTGDAGKVITPSSSTAGTSVLRNLMETEIADVIDYITVYVPDVATAGQTYVAVPNAGTIVKFTSTLQAAITGADELCRLRIGGTLVTDSQITITQSGSAAGDVDTATPTANNVVTANQALEVEYDGASTGPASVVFVIGIKRS